MEENTEIQESQAQALAEEQPQTAQPQAAMEETPAKETEAYKPRKNHRNKSQSAKKDASAENSACGEIADISSFREKLSGKHIEGYSNAEGGSDEEFAERRSRRRRFENSEESPNGAEQEPKREGPSFEKPEFKPRAVEVSLDNSRPDFKKPEAKPDFVSYNSIEEPKIGFFKRIKNLFASLFKKEKKNGAKFRKNRKPDWKKNRKFSNSKDGFKKGGDFKNRKHFRPHNRRGDKGFKPRNANSDKQ
ncbi:MAG: hypothetical protein IKO42_06650 [Opitutales bacterium]|nr:hypothetical protein [Opitutales bacterium]